MSDSAAAPAPESAALPAPQRRMSSLARIFGVFYSPAATFEDIAREPHFVLAWVTAFICSGLFSYALLSRVGRTSLARQMLMASSRAQSMSPQQLDLAIRQFASFVWIQISAIPFVALVFMLILAAIFLGVENFMLGQTARYKGVLAVVSHAYMPLQLLALVGVLVLYLRPDPTTVDFQWVVGSTAAYYFDPQNTSRVMMALLGRLDIFVFWTMALLALGLAKLGKKLKFGTALSAVIGLWVIWVLIIVGLSAIS